MNSSKPINLNPSTLFKRVGFIDTLWTDGFIPEKVIELLCVPLEDAPRVTP